MIGGVGYLDFKNISYLKSFAKKILVPDNDPFKEICQKPTGDKIDEFYTMRNYLAHYSYAATRKLESVYKKEGMKKFREPGDYLLSFNQKNSKRRINVYIDAFVKAANEMATFLGIQESRRGQLSAYADFLTIKVVVARCFGIVRGCCGPIG